MDLEERRLKRKFEKTPQFQWWKAIAINIDLVVFHPDTIIVSVPMVESNCYKSAHKDSLEISEESQFQWWKAIAINLLFQIA